MNRNELKDLSQIELEKELLIANVLSANSQSGISSKLSHFASIGSAIGALIAALVAYNIATNDNSRKLNEIFKEKAELIKLQSEFANLKNKKEILNQEVIDLNDEVAEKHLLIKKLKLDVRSYRNASQNLQKNNNTGLNIEITKKENLFSLFISTEPHQAKISLFYNCKGTFIYPIESPVESQCEALSYEHVDQQSPFEVHNLHAMGGNDNKYWVVADFGTHKVAQLVNL